MKKQEKRLRASGQLELIRPPEKIKLEHVMIRNISLSSLLIIILGFIVYSNTFHVPFLFDDESSIYKNIAITDSGYFTKASVSEILTSPRIIGQMTFAMNYAMHGLNVVGYHVVNLLIHVGGALLLYWFYILTFKTPYVSDHFSQPADSFFLAPRVIALFTALLFVSHPIQTQAVTYIVQRYASLATLFYLFSLVMYIKFRLSESSKIDALVKTQDFPSPGSLPGECRGRELKGGGTEVRKTLSSVHPHPEPAFAGLRPLPSRERGFWTFCEAVKARYIFYAMSVISAVLAMKTKEIAFTLPVMIILYEFMFFRGKIRKRIIYLIPLTLTMIIIPLSLIGVQGSSPDSAVSIDELTKGASLNIISAGDYLTTQFRVIVTYIRLLFLPINQNLDYDYPVYKTFFTLPVFFPFLFLLMIFGWGVYLLYRSCQEKKDKGCWYRLIAFGIFWFFVTLSVESSIIPIADVINEYRLYLPSVGFFIAVMAGVMWFTGRWVNKPLIKKAVFVAMILVIAALSATAYARNGVWRDELTLWEDVVKKSPNKARPHNNLGGIYLVRDRIDEAMKEMRLTLRLVPNYVEAYNNLGLAFEKLGQTNNAITHYLEAIRMNPQFVDAHSNLGVALNKQGRAADAIKHVTLALQINPHHAEANNNMGLLSEEAGRIDEAITYYHKALNNNPGYADGHNNLGNALIRSGKIDAAIEHIALALQLNPNFAEAEFNMGNVLLIKGLLVDALSHYTKALYIKPDYAEAHNNLGSALMKLGNYDEAIGHYRKALLLRGNYEDASKNLQLALKKVKKQNDGSRRN